jgi:hypothetical protein
MQAKKENKQSGLTILLWSARVIGTLLVLTSLIFVGADIVKSISNHTNFLSGSNNGIMILTIIFFFLSMAGLIIALWSEGIGGLIALAGMFGVVILVLNNPGFNASIALFVFLLPSLLYLLYWWVSKKPDQQP